MNPSNPIKPLKVGIVGARGTSTILGFRSLPNVEVAAICDLHEGLLREQAERLQIPRTYRVFEDMLESDIDAVVVATPMQLHVQQSIQALEAGKHVLSEVTAGVTLDELWWLIETVERSGKVYMMAENYCYVPQHQVIRRMAEQGLFGEVYFGEGEYIHNIRNLAQYNNRRLAGDRPDETRSSWRKFWQLGKRGNFYPTHSLGPLMQWFQGDRIESVSCFGSGWHTGGGEFRQEDTTLTICRMASGKLIKLRLDCLSNRPHNLRYFSLQGTLGCYEAPRGLGDQHKIYIRSENDPTAKVEWRPLADYYDDYLPERYKQATEEQKASGHWGGDFFLVHDFVEAIRSGAKPAIDVYDACEWTAVAMLSELSVANGGRPLEMPDFRKNWRDVSKQSIRF
jgi:predicted dehydrogenase